MNFRLSLFSAACLLMSAIQADAQGLVAIQNYSGDFLTDQPLTWTVTGRGGFDHLEYSEPSLNSFESIYLQGGVGATFTEADQTTPWSTAIDLGAIQYLDDIERYDSTFYNARVAFNISHQMSQRLKFSDNFYITYEAQPNIAMGGTTTLFNGQYLYGFNNFNVSYAWSQRFSTTTSYTVDGIRYEDEITSAAEDRLSHLVAQQFSYALTKRTSLTGEYRYRTTRFSNASGKDFSSQFALAGVDHAWSERMTGSFRAGAEFFKSERVSNTAPYAEVALNYAVARQTQARWFGSMGFDGAELGNYESRRSIRTGVNVSHQVTKKLGVNAGVQYAFSDFDGGTVLPDVSEHTLLLSAGVNYRILENLSVDASYNYSTLMSDDAVREFQRNNVSLGMTASF
jgi:opacity protein-like surface antigen